MPSGEAPIAEASTVEALMSRQWSHRPPPPPGIVPLLTLVCWGIWLYLVMPLVSLLLWAFGVRFLFEQLTNDGYWGLHSTLVGYSTILLGLVGLLAAWIAWNVVRYGGSRDRRTVKKADVTDLEIRDAFRLDDHLLATMRGERHVRLDLDGDGRVVVTTGAVLPDRDPDRPEAPRERVRT